MSSNIQIQRICKFCSSEFIARTTVTQYCSDSCSKRAYKARLRTSKIEASNKETKQIKSKPIEDLKAREFLSVSQVSKLIGCSKQTVYNIIHSGRLRAVNILQKKIIIRRLDVDLLFEELQPIAPKTEPIKQIIEYDISECYNLSEVQSKYGIAERTLHELIRKNEVPRIKDGWYTFVPKTLIDQLLS